MGCGYEMSELGLPFDDEDATDRHTAMYSLLVCKLCRAAWLDATSAWFRSNGLDARLLQRESPGTGIFVRILGASVEVTEAEWKAAKGEQVPVRATPRNRPSAQDVCRAVLAAFSGKTLPHHYRVRAIWELARKWEGK